MNHSALTIGRYLLSIPDKDSGELVSNLKLQKLLYYAQGYYLALHGVSCPLFKDKIFAWKHGPVVKTVYNHYASCGDGALPVDQAPVLEEETREFLHEIYRVFGRYSAWALRDMTHKEDPWLKNYNPEKRDVEISISDLEQYFSHVQKSSREPA